MQLLQQHGEVLERRVLAPVQREPTELGVKLGLDLHEAGVGGRRRGARPGTPEVVHLRRLSFFYRKSNQIYKYGKKRRAQDKALQSQEGTRGDGGGSHVYNRSQTEASSFSLVTGLLPLPTRGRPHFILISFFCSFSSSCTVCFRLSP